MAHNKEERTLTRAEMEIMNILWEADAPMTTHAIIERMPDPKPAYSTVATFLKILCTKKFVNFRKVEGAGKTHEFFPMMSREFYARKFMKEVKHSLFGGSLKSLISFFIEEEEISDNELQEILQLMTSSGPSKGGESLSHSEASSNYNHPSFGGEGGGLL